MAAIAASIIYVIYGTLLAGRDTRMTAFPRPFCICSISHSFVSSHLEPTAGGTIFGMRLPVGPIKKPKATATKKKDAKKKN
jgi:hypothetical protein